MSKYISAEYIKALMKNDRLMQGNAEYTLWEQEVERKVGAMPSIEIVECDECLYKNECLKVVKNIDGTLTWLNWCSFGERI